MTNGSAKGLVAAKAAGLVAGVAALLGLLWYAQRPDPQPVPQPVPQSVPQAEPAPVAAPAPEAVAPPAPAAEPMAEPAPEPAAPPAPPRFDTVRITPAGEAVVAGHAAAGGAVLVQLDGAEAARTTANDAGDFVAMLTLPPSDAPRLMTLALETPQGLLVSPDQVVVEPIAPPAAAASPAAEPPTALLLSDQGATVLQGPEALPGAGVTIAAITYTPDGAVQLSGLGAPGQVVRLYLGPDPVAEAEVTASGGWMAALRDVAPGLYTLRADQIDATGKVTARFETPFQRETPELLAAALKPQAVTGTPVSPAPAAATGPEVAGAPPLAPPAPAAAGDSPALAVPETVAEVPAAPQTPAAPAADEAAPGRPVTVTVQPGYTLWRIARDNFGDGVQYVKVFEANKTQIRDPDLIYPGQVFTLPDR